MISRLSVYRLIAIAACALAFASSRPSLAVVVSTSDGNGLDGQWQEIVNGGDFENVLYSFNGTGNDINARYNGFNGGLPAGSVDEGSDGDGDDRNEWWVLRFDLSGVDKSLITGAELQVTGWRDSNLQKDLRLFGVNPGTAGVSTLDEATGTFEDVPGFLIDNELTTLGADPATTTYLGDFLFPNRPDETPPLQGDLLKVNQDLLDTTGPNTTSEPGDQGVGVTMGIDAFIRGHDQSEMVMFLVSGVASNGQVRIGTRDADLTNAFTNNDSVNGFQCGVAFNCAPLLSYEISEGVLGDANGDGDVNTLDIDPFVLALTNPSQYAIDFPSVDFLTNNDINGDTDVNTLDIDPFVALLTGGAASPTPEPASVALAALAFVVSLSGLRQRSDLV